MADLLKSNLVLFFSDKNSLDFADLLEKISHYYEAYSHDPEPSRNEFKIGNVEFRISIEKIYLEIQKYLNEE